MPESENPIEPGAPEPAIGGDGTPYDPQRAQELIHKFRDRERNTKNNLLGLGLSREAINRAMTAEAGDEPTPSPAADNSERQLKIHSALIDGLSDAGMDRRLSVAALTADKKLLDGIDPASESLEDDVADMLDTLAARHPALRTHTATTRLSGSPFPTGGDPNQPSLATPQDISRMSPDAVAEALKAGKFSHLGIPGVRAK